MQARLSVPRWHRAQLNRGVMARISIQLVADAMAMPEQSELEVFSGDKPEHRLAIKKLVDSDPKLGYRAIGRTLGEQLGVKLSEAHLQVVRRIMNHLSQNRAAGIDAEWNTWVTSVEGVRAEAALRFLCPICLCISCACPSTGERGAAAPPSPLWQGDLQYQRSLQRLRTRSRVSVHGDARGFADPALYQNVSCSLCFSHAFSCLAPVIIISPPDACQ